MTYQCPKIPYPSRGEAKRVARQSSGGMKVYQCRYCGYFHLSTKSEKQVRNLRRKGRG